MLQSFATRWYTVLQFGKKKYRNPDEGLYSLLTHCTYQRSSISLALQNWTHTLKQRLLTIRKAIGLHFECTHKDLVGLWLTLRASYLWNIIPSKIFPIRPEQIQSPPFFPWLEAPGEKFWLIRTLAWKVAVKIWTTGHWPTNSLGKVNAQIGPHEKVFPGSDSSMTSPLHIKYWYSLTLMWRSMLRFMNVLWMCYGQVKIEIITFLFFLAWKHFSGYTSSQRFIDFMWSHSSKHFIYIL